jgi:hypothetical protein
MVNSLLTVMPWVNSRVDDARFGAIWVGCGARIIDMIFWEDF